MISVAHNSLFRNIDQCHHKRKLKFNNKLHCITNAKIKICSPNLSFLDLWFIFLKFLVFWSMRYDSNQNWYNGQKYWQTSAQKCFWPILMTISADSLQLNWEKQRRWRLKGIPRAAEDYSQQPKWFHYIYNFDQKYNSYLTFP